MDTTATGQRTTTFATPTDRTIVIARVVDAPRELVFALHTDPAHVPNWMLGPDGWTMPVCEIDLRPGGAWHFVWRRDDGTEMSMRGTYREVEPPARCVSTESWGEPWPETVNTLELVEDGAGRTTITTTMTFASRAARDAALASGMRDGNDRTYERLEDYVRTLAAR